MILAIDPATKTGWAFKYKDYWMCNTVLASNARLRAEILGHARLAGCTHVICEDQHLEQNPATFKFLIELRKDWEWECKNAGMIVLPPVLATVWQKAMLNIGGQACPVGETKKASIAVARMLGADPKDDNQADAVCIAEYAARMGWGK